MGRRFVDQRRRDPYYRAAQEEGLRSRAAFKLVYLDDRFHFLHPGARVLDLGAAPGGWSMVALDRVGRSGEVVAVDPRPVAPAQGLRVVRARVGEPGLDARLGPESFDVVLSDMSPSISGAYSTDHARSVELVRLAYRLARRVLAPGGAFVAKVFAGDMLDELVGELRPSFGRVLRTKPPASRAPSSELYVVALKFRHDSRRELGSEAAVASRPGPAI
ncbi:MAG TPA: RlmE family RNA methyltransferase [Thermoplasmata archaeon]|nr:RlmE family RNA methyltransferase [Thermoplasmata archaeon]HYB78024.1 RlmE family RNA methyltransferase [Thermoplasmata archaeon]